MFPFFFQKWYNFGAMNKLIQCFEEITSHEGSLFIYSLSYSLLLTIAPAITIFVAFFSVFVLDVDLIVETLSLFLPSEYIAPFVDFLLNKESINTMTSIVSMIISFWLASRSNYSFLLISSKREEVLIPKWIIRAESYLQFLVVTVYVIGAAILITSLSFMDPWLMPVVYLIAAFFGFYMFYRFSSFLKREKSYGVVGALAATLGVLLIGILFFEIINRFTNYDNVYGPLSSLVILFLSIYLIASVIYIGYILNQAFASKPSGEIRNSQVLKMLILIDDKIVEKAVKKLMKEK